ncbi:MAG: FAD-binding oxidoreductase [Oligoflexia bacterium]|nr:FAD-binding oxidoreductase [Oligoflexia bacterium]
MSESFLASLKRDFPADFLSQKPADLEKYGKDWTKVYAPKPSIVVFPRNTDEVVRLVKLCAQNHMPLVPSGGRTGLSGGAVAANGEVVLSFEKMNQMGPVDVLAQTVRVQAGAVTEAVHQHCAPHGLTWPIDFASKGSSHVGGNIATNAGGVKVIHYGMTRNWVLGLQVVTMNGEVLELNGSLEKNNTGADLRQLFIGSEGTLGIVTEAILKLTRVPRQLDVFFFAVDDMSSVLKLFLEARRAPFTLMAFETLTHNCLEAVQDHLKLKSPFTQKYGAYVLMEVERPDSENAQTVLDQWLEGLFEKGFVHDGTLAQSPREARDLWSLREGTPESIYHRGLLHKNDISLPISSLEAFVRDMTEMYASQHSGLEVYLFGHIGDGNLHVNTLKPAEMDREVFLAQCVEADRALYEIIRKYHGSISAEHGIGLLKKKWLDYTRAPAEIALLKSLKQVFDPMNLLNPGKIFD